MAVGTGVAAVVAMPVVLAGAGFMDAGVAPGAIADMLQVHVHILYKLENIKYEFVFFTII